MALDVVHDVDRLRGEIDEMRKDLKSLSRALRDRGTEKGHEVLDMLEHYGKRARKHAARTEARVERHIEERPFISILAAFGAGFLIAKLLDGGR